MTNLISDAGKIQDRLKTTCTAKKFAHLNKKAGAKIVKTAGNLKQTVIFRHETICTLKKKSIK